MSGMPRNYDEDISREPYSTSTPCPECGCSPYDAWGCECSNPYCPCSEPEDEDGEDWGT